MLEERAFPTQTPCAHPNTPWGWLALGSPSQFTLPIGEVSLIPPIVLYRGLEIMTAAEVTVITLVSRAGLLRLVLQHLVCSHRLGFAILGQLHSCLSQEDSAPPTTNSQFLRLI